MSTMATLIAFGIVVLGGFLVIVLFVAIYNRLVTLQNRYKIAYSQIDVQLKRRYDLIPNLVETSKAYMAHERQTLEAVIAARNAAMSANAKAAANPVDVTAIRGASTAENALLGVMGRFMMLVEAYPDLKANQTMLRLMEELSSTENRVAFARQAYNDAVMMYNTSRAKFPNVMVANSFKFGEAQLFEISNASERETPKISVT